MSIVFAESAWEVVSAFIVFILGAVYFIQRPIKSISANTSILIYLWHTLFCVFYAWFTLYNTADAPAYFRRSLEPQIAYGVGTQGVDAFTAILTQGFHLSYIGAFLVFNILGAIGLAAFAGALRDTLANKSLRVRWMSVLLVFLPGVSFWSVAIGKDAPAFMATGLLCWAALNLSKRWILILISIAIYAIVRPHVVAIVLLALVLAIVCSGQLSPAKKAMIVVVLAAPIVFGVQVAMSSTGLGSTFADVQGLVDYRQSVNLDGGGAVDISSMILPLQMFVYGFGPLFIGAGGLMGYVASVENAFLLLVVLFAVGSIRRGKTSLPETAKWFYLFFALALWIIFATTTANLGIALRQKWMFMPMMLIFCLSYLPVRQSLRFRPLGGGRSAQPVRKNW